MHVCTAACPSARRHGLGAVDLLRPCSCQRQFMSLRRQQRASPIKFADMTCLVLVLKHGSKPHHLYPTNPSSLPLSESDVNIPCVNFPRGPPLRQGDAMPRMHQNKGSAVQTSIDGLFFDAVMASRATHSFRTQKVTVPRHRASASMLPAAWRSMACVSSFVTRGICMTPKTRPRQLNALRRPAQALRAHFLHCAAAQTPQHVYDDTLSCDVADVSRRRHRRWHRAGPTRPSNPLTSCLGARLHGQNEAAAGGWRNDGVRLRSHVIDVVAPWPLCDDAHLTF